MAITIQQQPTTDWSAAFSPVAFTLTSTNSNLSQFNFVADVYTWDGADFVLLGRMRAPAIKGVGVFEISGLLSSTLDPTPNMGFGFSDLTSFYGRFKVTFYEEYDSTGGIGFPLVHEETEQSFGKSTPKYYWAASDNSLASQTSGTDFRFLLGAPRDKSLYAAQSQIGIRVRMEDRVCLAHLPAASGTRGRRLKVITWRSNATIIATKTFALDSGAPDAVVGWSVGPIQINALNLDEGGAAPLIDKNVSFYTVQLVNSTGSLVCSELVRFDLDCRKMKMPARRIHWLNMFGGLDSLSFHESLEFGSDKKTYDIGDMELSGTAFGTRQINRPLVQTSDAKLSAEYTSNFLTERSFESLKGLAMSSRVWMVKPSRIWCVIGLSGDGHCQVRPEMNNINRGDDNLTGTHWMHIGDTSGWSVVDLTGTPVIGGYVDITGPAVGDTLFELDWNQRSLMGLAITDCKWTRAKDNLRQFTFKAELPAGDRQWR